MNSARTQRKVHVATLGCKLNQYDSEAILTQFRGAGYVVSDASADADVCVINTCSVTATAESKARNLIRATRRQNPDAQILAVGCMAERDAEQLTRLSGVHAVLGNREKEHILDFLPQLDSTSGQVFVGETRAAAEFVESAQVSGLLGRTRSFLKVQDGCSQKCTYCIIPQLRGRGRSITIPAAVERARHLAEQGFVEVVLTGVALGTFGFDRDERDGLTKLLAALEQIDGLRRIRLGSVEPWAITENLIDLIADSEKICPHLHIPFQSGEDSTLHRMNRRYTTGDLQKIFERAFALRDDWGFGSDMIVGFPGESDEDFAATCRFLDSLPLSYLHIFPFSPRPGTPATKLPGHVPDSVKHARATQLAELDQNKRRAFRARFLGTTLDVLIENRFVGGYLAAHAANYLDVYLPPDSSLPGTLRTVRITGLHESGVVAELTS
jgi:threonylcarbamoyladenosine tRNA methylthiotransferase MtaB